MHRTRALPIPFRPALAFAAGLALLAAAPRPCAADGSVTTTTTTTASAGAATTALGTEASAQVATRAALARTIETRAATANAAEVEKQTSKMVAAAHRVDTDLSTGADTRIAGRLAADFHLSASDLAAEKQTLDLSWGNLMIAHTLSASAAGATNASVADLVALHKDGMGWGKIAAGLGFKLGPAVSAVEAEGRVATGQAPASGKLPRIAAAHGPGGDPDAAGADGAAARAGEAAGKSADAAARAAGRVGDAAAHVDAGLHVGRAGGH